MSSEILQFLSLGGSVSWRVLILILSAVLIYRINLTVAVVSLTLSIYLQTILFSPDCSWQPSYMHLILITWHCSWTSVKFLTLLKSMELSTPAVSFPHSGTTAAIFFVLMLKHFRSQKKRRVASLSFLQVFQQKFWSTDQISCYFNSSKNSQPLAMSSSFEDVVDSLVSPSGTKPHSLSKWYLLIFPLVQKNVCIVNPRCSASSPACQDLHSGFASEILVHPCVLLLRCLETLSWATRRQ